MAEVGTAEFPPAEARTAESPVAEARIRASLPPVNRVMGNTKVRRGLTVSGVKLWLAGISISMLVTAGR